ncbi:carboxymuconolactone decarboxylase family protein [Nocardia beijingensis]|uniref:carboxymuconolactone decarboxylase family protein n=1 Tax=Nocardia beijingensis TaxID=95162 RepID=UPI00344FAC25
MATEPEPSSLPAARPTGAGPRPVPRITPGTRSELGVVNWILCRLISSQAGVPDAQLFSTLGRTGRVFRGWLHYTLMLMPGGRLSRADTETIILRVAHRRSCRYELEHHTRIGRRAGIDEAALARIRTGPDAAGLDRRARILLTAVDELLDTRSLSASTAAMLSEHYSQAHLIEILLVITQYDGLAAVLSALEIVSDFASPAEET